MAKYVDYDGLDHFYDNIADRPVHMFNTVADMQAATWLKSGMTCRTNGFHSAGDGGAAHYTVGTTGTANGMDVLALQGGLFATLVVQPEMSVAQFGIVPSNSDVHDKLNYVFNGFDCFFYVPNGTYVLSDSVNIEKDNSQITFGEGAKLVCTSSTSTGTLLVVRNTNDSTGDVSPTGVKNVLIRGGIFSTSQSTENAIGVGIGCENVTIENCVVELAGYKGITVQYACKGVSINGCQVEKCVNGITVEGNTASSTYIKPSAIVTDCVINEFTNIGIGGLGCDKLIVQNNLIDNPETISTKTGASVYVTDTQDAIISENIVSSDTQGLLLARCDNAILESNVISAGDRGINVASTNVVIDSNIITDSKVIGCIVRNDGSGATEKKAVISNNVIKAASGTNGIWLLGDLVCSASNNDVSGGSRGLTNQSTNNVIVMGGQYNGSADGFGSTTVTMAACLNNGAVYKVGLS